MDKRHHLSVTSKSGIKSNGVTKILTIPIIALCMLSICASPVFAQTAPNITTSVDKPSYTIGDTIVVSGIVKAVVPGTPLTIQILDNNNNLVQVAQIDISQDGKYAANIKATGPLWKSSGTYTAKVQYGPSVTAQATFIFDITAAQISNHFIVTEPVSQQTFTVNYTISGGTVKNMTLDTKNLSLIVLLNSTNDGAVTLQIPRILLDAKTDDGQDTSFIILIDDAEVAADRDVATSNDRTITVSFLKGDNNIVLIGTQVIPEFSFAIPILVISIASVLVIYRKKLGTGF